MRNGSVFYVHTDHLGTPRRVTDADNSIVWSWDSNPFGTSEPVGVKIGKGKSAYIFAFNLRFPGQYYDAESGLHYNYFRYYDPSTGRYITSDPIGLAGGLNTYGYVLQNPLIYIDPLGLCGRGFSEVEGNPGVCKANGLVNPDRCASGECGAYGGTNPLNANAPPRVPRRKSDCSQCREQCIQEFINPIPGLIIEKGAGAAGKKINDLAGDFAKDIAKKGNKVKGAYDLSECLDSCKKTCNDNFCE